jgi:hypothetical protein
MSNPSDILEGLHFSILEKWVKNGKIDDLPEGMVDYMSQLTAVLGFNTRSFNKTQIIKRLRATFGLSYQQAKSRWIDAVNYFYLDNDVKYEARINLYIDKLDKIADTIIQTATSEEEMLLAVKPIIEAAKLLKEVKPKELVPDELFTKPNKVYTFTPEDVGLESANRNILGQMIDQLEIDEADKFRIKQDAGVAPKQLFQFHEQKDND